MRADEEGWPVYDLSTNGELWAPTAPSTDGSGDGDDPKLR